ncbi:aminopeptidase [Terrihabitans soli]|uniref:Aminopeptidase n=1 Tax=Terrihabitans soli TaxID=708113 RepID=A0A6S6QQS8_9HYPH|nr:aminopeptidase P family protein [Terrihabitans soli]BCJ91399.1 aminopeptidase [Terrihabitans soli]
MFDSVFQSFDDSADSSRSKARLAVLRADMKRLGLFGFLVPRADAHQNEYVPASEERLAWLTGFTGSAGTALITLDQAVIFVDGRYTVQVRDQIDKTVVTPVNSGETSPSEWIRKNFSAGQVLGFDPWLHTADAVERLRKAVADAGAELKAVDENPIDISWTDRPEPPLAPVVEHPEKFAGESADKKLARLHTAVVNAKADAIVLTDPHEIAWLFNIRGGDVAHTPLPLAWAVIPVEGRPALLIDGRKLSNELRDHLEDLADVGEPSEFETLLNMLGGKKVMFDFGAGAERIRQVLNDTGATIVKTQSPIALMKAVKNGAEIRGTRAAHQRDGVAFAQFLFWLDTNLKKKKLDEIEAAEALEAFRRDTAKLKDISFPTISAAGPNAALPHYRVTRATNRKITPGLYLVDSGAQYQDGTTDITRTIAIGKVTKDMRDRYTRVLKGHIAIATAQFPKGATGAQLDPLARRALWEIGADFDHGTGHGVGSYLSVHEGPQRISKLGHTPLEPGMILSNEPGYYKEGAFGIRIENLVLVERSKLKTAERDFLSFETLTLAPIDTRPIDPKLLTKEEVAWLDAYHKRVASEIGPKLDPKTRAWLKAVCAPLLASAQKKPKKNDSKNAGRNSRKKRKPGRR